jgi:N6-L-threonylcarbamoyladenine synthase
MIVLAIETSCDETAVAILCSQRGLLASEIASQIAIHQAYGGVVPEVASRSHLTQLRPVIDAALRTAGVQLDAIDAVAATAGPGLATSLMIGMSAAKGVALGLGKPFLAVNHLEGHLLSPFFPESAIGSAVGLVVSGGHTLLIDIAGFCSYRLLGRTQDDAAGEAFDKVGKLLGLPYPAGPVIDRMAREGDETRYDFPRSMLGSGDFHFSFSGLKTSVRYLLPKLQQEGGFAMADVCASFQEAVVDVLVGKTMAAVQATGRDTVAMSGGVSCNHRLRQKMSAACERAGVRLRVAESGLCTDNAAMIAFVALHHACAGAFSPITADIDPNLKLAY